MDMPLNTFKQALLRGEPQIGLWLGLAHAYSAELAANADFDWLLLDAEHAPNDLRSLLSQLQAIAPYRSQPVVRPPVGDTALIKQYLDLGAQTLLVPMVETADQARQLVRDMRYPPEGVRGVGSALARASRWNSVPGYLDKANHEMCLLVQIESRAGLDNLDDIAAVDGVDGVFIGPADLSAALGHRGNPGHPEVQSAIEDAIRRILAAGKAPGILYADTGKARHFLDLGCLFVAVGVDTSLLMGALKNLAGQFKPDDDNPTSPSVY
ncbi:2,4-dihydroxyhept-2-ene-1,7-dioic acid aldolase, with PEP/pyruvate domain [Alloalcanivorax dieselolei B5]|uniref:2,4-dihydroxyhept-2-ene-1,7-dioic acid aldolase, with PEP/pyruvate domain n=1 Tax=Alcanivorax dieselolei (strain DSM 16502 / CGMCC 1.3690 / MCCC 1A00001 / B-5) TaxID=930169 RepID=K0CD84_ALCDB|nr:4-hydroxy-2-oxoheptanedioate aldolase [Alloalcanivorax dieselolei]AFT71564.1 2,4-dihydroxyhept-2-ene-1,7-dioic acid aldolase, with PEP/pyruvate domain [Alloalcanivorax dieselolei B5]GGJ89898.1 2,4-dihydroxyhept-2-ene-1,7-dioic acid aldolase [Alloalcanivorax dieselolei]